METLGLEIWKIAAISKKLFHWHKKNIYLWEDFKAAWCVYEFLLPWWCGPLRQTQYIYHQSQPRLQQPDVPRERGVGWCRSARPCPRRRWSDLWSTWPSGHLRSVDEELPRCGGSVCSVPRLLSPPKLCRRGEWQKAIKDGTEDKRGGHKVGKGKKRKRRWSAEWDKSVENEEWKEIQITVIQFIIECVWSSELLDIRTLHLNTLEKLTSKPTKKMSIKLLLRKWSHFFLGHPPSKHGWCVK